MFAFFVVMVQLVQCQEISVCVLRKVSNGMRLQTNVSVFPQHIQKVINVLYVEKIQRYLMIELVVSAFIRNMNGLS